MLRLLGIVLSIGFADSINPSTVAPALYLASVEHHAAREVLRFTLGVFAVSLIGGMAIALGPGELLLGLVPHPRPAVGYWLEIVAGAVLIVGGLLLWRFRRILAQRELIPRADATRRRSSLLLGAGIMAVELPTAFPYFAAIAAIVGSGRPVAEQVILVAVYNGIFVLPLAAIGTIVAVTPARAEQVLGRARRRIEANWPTVVAVVAVLAGAFVVALGATGLAAEVHNSFGHLAGHVHHLIS